MSVTTVVHPGLGQLVVVGLFLGSEQRVAVVPVRRFDVPESECRCSWLQEADLRSFDEGRVATPQLDHKSVGASRCDLAGAGSHDERVGSASVVVADVDVALIRQADPEQDGIHVVEVVLNLLVVPHHRVVARERPAWAVRKTKGTCIATVSCPRCCV